MRRGAAKGIARTSAVRPLSDDGSRASRAGSSARNAEGDRARPGAVSRSEVATVKRHRVVLERDETGAWIATVPAVPGCHSYGRSLVEARRRVREALGLWVEDADRVELSDDIRIPRDALAAVRQSVGSREKLASARDAASATTTDAVHRLVDELGLGVRDAAYLLGLSHQRVQQLVRGSS